MNNRKEKGKKLRSRLRFCQTIKANIVSKVIEDIAGNTLVDVYHPKRTIIHNRYALSKERV